VIRHGRNGEQQPAIDTHGILDTIQIPLASLPHISSDGRKAPPSAFKKALDRALIDRLATWETKVSTALAEQQACRRDATLAEQRENGDPAYIGYHSTHMWTWAEVVRQPIAAATYTS
jgi:hypothetical protein